MLTILNMINYFIGKQLSLTAIVTLSIAIYAIIISLYWDTIFNNSMYLWIIIILLILDIASIIVIFSNTRSNIFISENCEIKTINSDNESNVSCKDGVCKISDYKKKEKKEKKKKKKKILKIPTYDGKTNTSIHTYI